MVGVTDRSWIVWVLERMREAMEEKVWNTVYHQRSALIRAISLSLHSPRCGPSYRQVSNA